MTEPDRYGEEIRRALSAAAELVVPAGDGLDIIRKRAARRPPMLAWLLAYVSYVPRQMTTRVRVMASELAVMARGESELLSRLRARLRPKAGQARSAQAWLRPALAAAGALLLVVSVTFAVPKLRATITNQANNGPSGPGGAAGQSGQALGNGYRSGQPSASIPGFGSGSGGLGVLPAGISGRGPSGTGLYILLPPGTTTSTSPTPCTTGTPATSPSGTIAPTGGTSPTGSPGTVPGGGANAGAPNDPAGQQIGGYAGGQPNCAPSGSSTPTTPPTSTPPTSTPPTSTPPTSTPPTSTPPTSTPPTSDAPSSGSTASTPADTPSAAGS
ncbi:MAG TPA: hypothetical protein VGM53_36095 [Streptosporangiaceae bacterium]